MLRGRYIKMISKGADTSSISQSQSITFSTTLAYNSAVGGQVGISELVSLSASKGYGITTGMSFTSTSVRTYTKTISSSAQTGLTDSYYMPYGNSTVTCLYSPDNASWGIFY